MSKKILFITSTSREAQALTMMERLIAKPGGYSFGNIEIDLLISGIGPAETAYGMMKWLSQHTIPDLIINGGIAGSYNDSIRIGDVVMPVSDCFADLGVEEGANFLTLSEAGITNPDEFPFKNGILVADSLGVEIGKQIAKPVKAITLNMSTGTDDTKNRHLKKYNPDIETMEGATFFYICAREKIPFLALRAVSNMVEPRNKANWDITLAINNLSGKIKELFIKME